MTDYSENYTCQENDTKRKTLHNIIILILHLSSAYKMYNSKKMKTAFSLEF